MNTKDFERLKAVCEKEGFEITIANRKLSNIFEVHKKDIWDGVEFAESLDCLDWGDGKFTKGKIYILNKIGKTTLTFKFDDNVNPINASSKDFFKPSTESAYIEQLKKEAFERFGDIKVGDRFTSTYENAGINTIDSGNGFRYGKYEDYLSFNGWVIYRQGKWATKLKERIRVDIDQKCWAIISKGKQEIDLTFLINKPVPCIESMKTFLASQLEKYLNDEID